MQKWEYLWLAFDFANDYKIGGIVFDGIKNDARKDMWRGKMQSDLLNALGDEGWELCAQGEHKLLYFKRPKS